MKNVKKIGIGFAAAVAVAIIAMECLHQYGTVFNDVDIAGSSAANGVKPPALVPLEIVPPVHMQFDEFFNRSMRPVPNLEENRGYGPADREFLVPIGTTNIGLDKPVSSSDNNHIIGSIGMINDGKKEYGKYGGYVELGPGLQHITIDLLQRCEIYAIVVWHSHLIGPVYFDVVVQASDDPAFAKGVRTLFNNDADGSSGLGVGQDKNYRERHQGKLIDANGVRARYVRLYSNGYSGNEMNHYLEVEVYGKPL